MVQDKTAEDMAGSLAASRLIRTCRDLLLLRVSKDRLLAVSCDAVEGIGSKLRYGWGSSTTPRKDDDII